MYGLDKTTDLQSLKGKRLLQVCIGEYQVILKFTEHIEISIEGSFECNGCKKDLAEFKELSHPACCLLDLLEEEINDVGVEAIGTLVLNFSNESTLKIFDSNQNAESYQINGPLLCLVV